VKPKSVDDYVGRLNCAEWS